jgi:Domain of unknown function (DUF1707)
VPQDDARTLQLQRAQVLRRLIAACADGRLEPGELAARAEAAQQADRLPGLVYVIADIPGPGQAAVAGRHHRARRFILGFLTLAGWPPRPLRARVVAAAVLGEVVIDLRRTAVTSFETTITAVAVAGEVRILVPAGFRAEIAAPVTVLGRVAGATWRAWPGPLTPVIRIRRVAVLGTVLISRAPPGQGS